MKTLRLLPLGVLLSVLSVVGGTRLHAQTITWIGGSGTPINNVTDDANWSAPLVGDGSDDVEFGISSFHSVYVPGGLNALHDLNFTDSGGPSYNFAGNNDSSYLVLAGDLSAAATTDTAFSASLSVKLSDGSHTADIGANATVTVESDISNQAAGGGILKTGTGTLILAHSSSTFSGGVTVNAGTLVLGADSIADGSLLSSPVGLGTLTLLAGTTLSMYEEYSFDLYTDINLGAGAGMVTVNTTDYGSLTLHNTISGSAGLDKTGAGVLVLASSDSSFSGGVAVQAGTLLLGASSSFEVGIWGPVGAGSLKLHDGAELGVASGAGPITLHNPVVLDADAESAVIIDTSNDDLTLLGEISGAAQLTKAGSNALNLYGDNSFTGPLHITAGQVHLHGNNSAGDGGLSFGSSGEAVFHTLAPVITGLSSASETDAEVTLNVASSRLKIDQDFDSTYYGSLRADSGGPTNDGVFVKAGPGTLTLQGSWIYGYGQGANKHMLEVQGGTLVLSDVHFENADVAVVVNGGTLAIANGTTFANPLLFGGSGGTLGGNGTFSSPLTLGSNVVLSPGNSPGTLTFSAGLTANNGLTTDIEINGAANNPGVTSDLIVTGGTGLNLSAVTTGGYTLRIISLNLLNNPGAVDGLTGPASWTIFQNSALTGFVTDGSQFLLDIDDFVGGGIFSLTKTGNDLVLNFTPVPEPSTYALIACGLAGLWFTKRRRNRRLP